LTDPRGAAPPKVSSSDRQNRLLHSLVLASQRRRPSGEPTPFHARPRRGNNGPTPSARRPSCWACASGGCAGSTAPSQSLQGQIAARMMLQSRKKACIHLPTSLTQPSVVATAVRRMPAGNLPDLPTTEHPSQPLSPLDKGKPAASLMPEPSGERLSPPSAREGVAPCKPRRPKRRGLPRSPSRIPPTACASWPAPRRARRSRR
jgi:hypothetical protein